MLIYKNKHFNDWAKNNRVFDMTLIKAIEEVNQGLVDANLGGNIYKKRLDIANKGKSGGARTIIAFKYDDKAFFVFAFKKGNQDNISTKELVALKLLAKYYFKMTKQEIQKSLENGELFLVERNNG